MHVGVACISISKLQANQIVQLLTRVSYILFSPFPLQCLRHTGSRRRLVALVGALVPDKLVLQLERAGVQAVRVSDVVCAFWFVFDMVCLRVSLQFVGV